MGDNMVRGYVLIETDVASAKSVGLELTSLSHAGTTIVSVDTVTGPFDVIVLIEAIDLDTLGNYITDAIQSVEGVQRTTTCLAVRLTKE
ncbi:uncharacterized protein METZ01_LOCUS390911 [marine metagenome]|mgnify:FL=1|uniref:Transcription regulator AsnC/Lrp ligand binding domain-containing protein n=1 Tax=marine metagenome TaxID=408172 RepID=A0A382UV81_9ZZZZ